MCSEKHCDNPKCYRKRSEGPVVTGSILGDVFKYPLTPPEACHVTNGYVHTEPSAPYNPSYTITHSTKEPMEQRESLSELLYKIKQFSLSALVQESWEEEDKDLKDILSELFRGALEGVTKVRVEIKEFAHVKFLIREGLDLVKIPEEGENSYLVIIN